MGVRRPTRSAHRQSHFGTATSPHRQSRATSGKALPLQRRASRGKAGRILVAFVDLSISELSVPPVPTRERENRGRGCPQAVVWGK
jgi:hypothetical protein